MKLYTAPASPYARKVRVLVLEKGLQDRIDEVTVNAYSDRPVLLQANPLGKVPTLEVNEDFRLFDSPVICEFLDTLPADRPPLIATEGMDRWIIRKTEARADGIMDLGVGLTLEKRKPAAERSPSTVARWRVHLGRAIAGAEIARSTLPERFTLGHAAAAVALAYLDYRHPELTWREERPELGSWHSVISDRRSLAETAPEYSS